MSETHSSQPTPDERFKQTVAILVASVAVLAAVLALLRAHAGTHSATATRQARRSTIEASGARNSGQLEVGYGLYSAQSWYELGMLAHSAERAYDFEAAQRYRTVGDQVAALSPLLSADYAADVSRYEADRYLVRATELSERAAVATALAGDWGSKGNAYVVQLTLLALALALYGLSTVVVSRVRWPFFGTASAIVGFALVWALVISLRPVHTIADGAVVSYARGVGLAYQDRSEEAIAAFDEALAQAPGYANALYERGNVHSLRREYQAAAADYEAARAAGRDDLPLAWNRGWTSYLRGRFDEAVELDRYALSLDPGLLPVRFNLALALLAAGRGEEAEAEYGAAMDAAARAVAEARAAGREMPFSFWFYLDVAARDLEGLAAGLDGESRPWLEAPPQETIAQPEVVGSAARSLRTRVKGLSVALETAGRPPEGVATARISPLLFSLPWGQGGGGFAPTMPRTPFESGVPLDVDRRTFFPHGDLPPEQTGKRAWPLADSLSRAVDTFPYDTGQFWVAFDYEGMQDGQQVAWKVYVNGKEDYFLRQAETWALGPAGEAQKPIYLAFSQPGEYQVEMYVDGHLVQQGRFTVEEPPAVEPAPPVVLEDDFSDPASGWDRRTEGGYVADYADGSYRIAIDETYRWVKASPGWYMLDSQVDVDATRVSGSNSGQFGLFCRLQDPERWDGYYFLISGDGRAGIGKQSEDEWTWLVEPGPAPAIRKGNATNHLRAVCAGQFLLLYVNEELVASARDAGFYMGEVGLVAATYQVAALDARFDNLVIRAP